MTSDFEWGPDDHAGRTIGAIFALALRPVPSWVRSAPGFAGANPLKWLFVVLVAVWYVTAIAVYWAFALIPAASYVFLRLLTLPLFLAVEAIRWTRRRAVREEVTPATTAVAAAPTPRRSTPRPGTSPG